MQIQDIFVGLVAIAAGLCLIGICLVNADWYFQLWKTRWFDQRFGRSLTRFIVALLGTLLIILGIAIIQGYAPHASKKQSCRPMETKTVIELANVYDATF